MSRYFLCVFMYIFMYSCNYLCMNVCMYVEIYLFYLTIYLRVYTLNPLKSDLITKQACRDKALSLCFFNNFCNGKRKFVYISYISSQCNIFQNGCIYK